MKIGIDVATRDDCELVRGWRNQDIGAFRTPFLLTEEMQAEFYRTVVCNRQSPHRYWAVREGDVLAGCVGLTNIAWENGTAELSLIVDPARTRQGIGQASVALALREGFLAMRLEAVHAEVYQSNVGATQFWLRMAERFHARSVALPARKFWNGQMHDAVFVAFERKRWRK